MAQEKDSTTTPPVNTKAAVLDKALIQGDLSRLTDEQRVQHLMAVCASMGLNPLTKPFEYITLNGKLTLYAKRDATDQLRKIYNVSIKIMSREKIEDVFQVTAQASLQGRIDESIGAVSIGNLRGDAMANALMKAETKAKRRVTLSICGLGLLDETELETIPMGPTPKLRPEMTAQALATAGDKLISDPQIKLLWSLWRQTGYSEDDLREHLRRKYKKESTKELTSWEASIIIQDLYKEIGKQNPIPPAG